MYSATTNDIRVTVQPTFLEEQSTPGEDHYVWAYQVRIENTGGKTVKLLNRYWCITDALGRIQEVKGEGVVGEQPSIAPGEQFEYTSGTPLGAPSGIMLGTYEMEDQAGSRFVIDIPAFSLDSPYQARHFN